MTTRKVRLKRPEDFEAFHYTGNNLDGLKSFVEEIGGMLITERNTTKGPRMYVEDHLFGHTHEVNANTFWVYRNPEMESHTPETFSEFYELAEEKDE